MEPSDCSTPNRHAWYKVVSKLNMQENRERWMELAELAANEQDPIKLLKLVQEITELLEKKQRRLNDLRLGKTPDSA
jgi:hypothetical protein